MTHRIYHKMLAVLTGLLCTFSLLAQEEMVFMPQWTAQSQFAGYYAAEALGYYREAGLKVRIEHPSASSNNIVHLQKGECQIVSLDLVTAMNLVDDGVPLINILQVTQKNCQMIIAQKPINTVSDLKGMRIGCSKAGAIEVPLMMDESLKLGIQWVPSVTCVNLFISKAVDAIVGMSYNELIQLILAGQRIQNNQKLYLGDIGYNIPQEGLYVTGEYYKRHKQAVKSFSDASKRGWDWCREHPEEALDIVMKKIRENKITTNRVAQRWMLEDILRAQVGPQSEIMPYHLSQESLVKANRLLLHQKSIKEAIQYIDFVLP